MASTADASVCCAKFNNIYICTECINDVVQHAFVSMFVTISRIINFIIVVRSLNNSTSHK